jgi:hypothetical protein
MSYQSVTGEAPERDIRKPWNWLMSNFATKTLGKMTKSTNNFLSNSGTFSDVSVKVLLPNPKPLTLNPKLQAECQR